jgi:hypothetical protein
MNDKPGYCDHHGTQVGMPCPFCGRINMNPTPTPPKTHAEVVDLEKLAQRIEDRNYTHEDADNAAEAIRAMSKLIDECRAAGYIDDAGNVRRDRLNEMREVRGWLSSALDRMELADVTRLPWLAAALTNSYQQLDAFIGEREAALHAKDAHAGEKGAANGK